MNFNPYSRSHLGNPIVDLVSTFTGPFPIMVIAEMLGVDPADRDLFKEWSNGIMATAAGDYESRTATPESLDDADCFDIHRVARKHIAFGSGIHFCMGANLARLEARVAFEELLCRFPEYSVTSDPLSYFNTPSIRGPKALRVRLGSAD